MRSSAGRGESEHYPGRALLGVEPALAAALLAFNVYYLRRQHPGILSGKLSDLAINFLLPVFLVAAAEWLLALGGMVGARVKPRVGRRGILIACVVSATYFTLLKTWPAFTSVHRALLAYLDMPFGGGRAFRNLADPTDLVTLVTTPLAAAYLLRRLAPRSAPPPVRE